MNKLASHLQIELTDNSFLMPLRTYQSTQRTMQALLVPHHASTCPRIGRFEVYACTRRSCSLPSVYSWCR